jgi:hypothetical protein
MFYLQMVVSLQCQLVYNEYGFQGFHIYVLELFKFTYNNYIVIKNAMMMMIIIIIIITIMYIYWITL